MEPITPSKIYTVSEVNARVRNLLEDAMPLLWISGEISNLYVQSSSGHRYFTLKDERAEVRCAMFRNYGNQLNFELKNGMQIVVKARVSLYEARGDYQLIVYNIEQAGIGILQRKFLELKDKLQKEGLFAMEHKKPLPKIPACIGAITSPAGAAIHDILSVLKRRFPFIPVIIYPTQVQGAEAAGQIVRAIEIANRRRECDVLIVARGGGSLEDLWPFNEEIVARAIFKSAIPIVSAVGHEVDFTISDFVADLRAPTPSVAAELVVPNVMEKLKLIDAQYSRLLYLMRHKIQHSKLMFSALRGRLQHPKNYLKQKAQKVDELERNLLRLWQHKVHLWQHKLTQNVGMLAALSPFATLKRGYAIVKHKGEIVKDAAAMKCGDVVDIMLAKGELECEVVRSIDNSTNQTVA